MGAAGGTVLARRRVRLDVLRQYTLEVVSDPAGARLYSFRVAAAP